MPNHCHAILRPFNNWQVEAIVGTWKQYTGLRINQALSHEGTFWQAETYDRIVRDGLHLWNCVQYIGNNPQKAGLRDTESFRWLSPAWRKLHWHFQDESDRGPKAVK